MSEEQKQPKQTDAVLGGQKTPKRGAVLGGIQAVKNNLESSDQALRVEALQKAINYGEEGLKLLREATFEDKKAVAKNPNTPVEILQSLAEQESNQTLDYANSFHLIQEEIANFFLAPSDATRVHYRTMGVRKEDAAFSSCGVFVATCLVEFDDTGNIIPSPLFKHRTNRLKSDGSRPEYRAFEAAPRKEGHETWESVASVKVTDLVFVPFDEDGVNLEETYQYKGTPEGFLKAQNAGLNANGFDFDPTIVSLGFLKGQVDPADFKKEMNCHLNKLGCTNGLFEVFIWGFASEVLTSSSETRNTESVFVNTNSFSVGARPYRTSNKKNGISRSNRGFTQGRDFAKRLIQRQKARNGEKVSPLGKPMEEEIDKAKEILKANSPLA